MLHLSSSSLNHLLGVYGYWAVLVFVFIESMGVPVPGETMLIAASVYAGATHHLTIWWVIVAAAAGAILGDNTGYVIGREGGYRLLRRYGRYIGVDERKLKVGQYLFRQHGGKVVFFGRFVSILRTWAAFLAGVNRMPWPRFLVFNAAGGILWATAYGTGAYFLGRSIEHVTGPVGIGLGVVAVILIAAVVIFLWRNEKRLEEEAERAMPGPVDQQAERHEGERRGNGNGRWRHAPRQPAHYGPRGHILMQLRLRRHSPRVGRQPGKPPAAGDRAKDGTTTQTQEDPERHGRASDHIVTE